MIDKYKPLKKLAIGVTTETLHGPIPTKTTMDLATGVLALLDEFEKSPSQIRKLVEIRGLTIISVLLNFVDWVKVHPQLLSEKERGKLVVEFLESHSTEKSHLLKAEDICKRLEIPFLGEDNENTNPLQNR
jgi:hypothetical protein